MPHTDSPHPSTPEDTDESQPAAEPVTGGSDCRNPSKDENATADMEKGLPSTLLIDEPYSAWSAWEKWLIVITASGASFFSPLSANIYYPIFNVLADVLHVSETLINVTVTTYMITQALAPMIIAGLSDGLGRRPAYLISFTIYLGANIGLTLQTSYPALATLRAVQSIGSSSTVALASAVVADIAVPAERGLYSSLTSSGIFLAPALGPVIGGLLAEFLSWRAVFAFLAISGGIFGLFILLVFPETCRNIVGNGSRRPAKWNMSLITYLHLRRSLPADGSLKNPPIKIPNVFQTLTILKDLELVIITFSAGMAFAAFYSMNTSVPSVFADLFGLSELQIGLCFLSVAFGCFVALLIQGRLVDFNYRRHAKRLGLPLEKNKLQDLRDFPIERARLEIAIPMVILYSLFTIGYGWTINFRTHIAAPLVFMFFQSLAQGATFTVLSVLVIDVWAGKPATASAAVNLVRCLLGAGATAAIISMMETMGRGWAFTLVGLLGLSTTLPLFLCMRKGQEWRRSKIK